MTTFASIGALRALWDRTGLGRPRAALILGSGLGPLADRITVHMSVPASSLPGYPASTVAGHDGTLLLGTLGGVPVAALKGRIHGYEGHSIATLGLPARVLCGLRPSALIVTNAAGGLHPSWRPGSVMLMRDHINLLGGSPLDGPNDDRLGPRFVDMSRAYPAALRMLVTDAAAALRATAGSAAALTLYEGTYVAVRGPQYETPAEVRMLAALGADAVGMSTVPEVIVAAHMGVPVLGMSVICNPGAGLCAEPIAHEDVLAAGRLVGGALSDLVARVVPLIPVDPS